jgi:hypothetical protein
MFNKRPEHDDDPKTIEETRQYIRDFDHLAAPTMNAQDLYNKMLELDPNRVNPAWALWSSVRAVMSAAAVPSWPGVKRGRRRASAMHPAVTPFTSVREEIPI